MQPFDVDTVRALIEENTTTYAGDDVFWEKTWLMTLKGPSPPSIVMRREAGSFHLSTSNSCHIEVGTSPTELLAGPSVSHSN